MGKVQDVATRRVPVGSEVGTRSGAQVAPATLQITDITLRADVPRAQMESEIVDFVAAHPGSDALDIAEALRLPLLLVEEVTENLWRQGVLREEG